MQLNPNQSPDGVQGTLAYQTKGENPELKAVGPS